MADAPSIWAVLEAIATAAAASFAGGQIFLSRRDANARAAFEHLREIDKRVQDAWPHRTSDAQSELLEYYRGDRKELSAAGRSYLALLNSLDLMVFAINKKLIDADVAGEYLRTLLVPAVFSPSFVTELQKCCGDAAIYEHLAAYFESQRMSSPSLPSQT